MFVVDTDKILVEGFGSIKTYCKAHDLNPLEVHQLTFTAKNQQYFQDGSKKQELAKRLVNLGVAYWKTEKQGTKNDKVSV